MASITHRAFLRPLALGMGTMALLVGFTALQPAKAASLQARDWTVVSQDEPGTAGSAAKPPLDQSDPPAANAGSKEAPAGTEPQQSDESRPDAWRPGCPYQDHDLGLIV